MPDLKKLITLEALQAALPSWLKSSTKPSYTADEISTTNTTNKFVTSTEKNTWNAKGTYSKPSGGIPKSDLSQLVQDSLDLANSALQSESDPTVPSWAKQTNKPSYTQDEVTDGTTYKRVTQTEKNAWSGKQNALTTTQMSAVNSGINSTKVSQISTNQTNILYGLEKIGTNLIKPRDDLPTVVTALPEGLRVQRSNTTSSFAYVKCGTVYLESGKKYALYDATYAPTTKHHYFYVDCGGNGFIELSTPSLTATVQYGTGRTTGTYDIYTRIDANSTVDTISTPIICLESVWKQLEAYTPYGAPNYDLTRLEAEDRAALQCDVKYAKVPVSTSYSLIGSIKTKGNRVCRITVTQEYASVAPTGLILSKSNQSSDFNTLTNRIAPPVETTTDDITLTISTLCYFTYDRVVYIWAKAKTASTNGNNFMALCEHFGDIDGVTKSMS